MDQQKTGKDEGLARAWARWLEADGNDRKLSDADAVSEKASKRDLMTHGLKNLVDVDVVDEPCLRRML